MLLGPVWTLSAADLEEVRKGRGPEHRQRFAVQLCALRALGRFVDDFVRVPVRIANHIGRHLGLPPSLFIEEPEHPATAIEHARRLAWSPPDPRRRRVIATP